MVGKKKGMSCQKEPNQPEIGEDGKENREKAEKDAARRRGAAPRRARGAIRGRECTPVHVIALEFGSRRSSSS